MRYKAILDTNEIVPVVGVGDIRRTLRNANAVMRRLWLMWGTSITDRFDAEFTAFWLTRQVK